MKEYILVSVKNLELIRNWLKEHGDISAYNALDIILIHSPRLPPDENQVVDDNVKFYVGANAN